MEIHELCCERCRGGFRFGGCCSLLQQLGCLASLLDCSGNHVLGSLCSWSWLVSTLASHSCTRKVCVFIKDCVIDWDVTKNDFFLLHIFPLPICILKLFLCSGHGSFSSNPKLNSVVGHLLHSSILVPYHGWLVFLKTLRNLYTPAFEAIYLWSI